MTGVMLVSAVVLVVAWIAMFVLNIRNDHKTMDFSAEAKREYAMMFAVLVAGMLTQVIGILVITNLCNGGLELVEFCKVWSI